LLGGPRVWDLGRKHAHEGEKGKAGGLVASRVKKGWAEEERRTARPKRKKERGERGLGFSLFLFKFFSNSFSNFANFTQTIKPCIRFMMHKHLLFLTLLK
jgi:hypothetical protein